MKKLLASLLVSVMVVGLSVPVFATKNKIDEPAKQEYYAEYIKIAQEVAKDTELDISVLPMSEFTEDDWRTPEDFRTTLMGIANWRIDCTELDSTVKSPSHTATKTATITIDGRTYSVSILGDFNVCYNSTTRRKHFGGGNSFTSKSTETTGTWKQLGCEFNAMDASRTIGVTVGGELTIAGAKFGNKLAYAEFYCSADGDIR